MTSFTTERDLSGRSVAILATDGFEESELFDPLEALEHAGVEVAVVSLPETPHAIRGEVAGEEGGEIAVGATVSQVSADDFDALLVPGGKRSVDHLRKDQDTLSLVRDFMATGKPVGAICHGPWVIAAAGEVRDRTMTSHPRIRGALERGGAEWVDDEVVIDERLVTSRGPADLEAFIEEVLDQISEAPIGQRS